MLLKGQYQHWKDLFTKWIKSYDYHCWLVISLGDKEIKDFEKKLLSHDWEQKDLEDMERNARATMYITIESSALVQGKGVLLLGQWNNNMQ